VFAVVAVVRTGAVDDEDDPFVRVETRCCTASSWFCTEATSLACSAAAFPAAAAAFAGADP
jgi:hypothetical protein